MRIKNLLEGLNAQQRSVPQLPAQARARHISVLGSKTDPKHPFAGYMVGADESVEEGRAGVDDTDTVGFSVNTEKAYTAVMQRFGDYIDHDETSGIMYAPSRIWLQIEMTAFDADGEGATKDTDMSEATGDKPFDSMMQNISKGTKKQAATDKNDQKKQSQQQARAAFGSMFGGENPVNNLKIREQGVTEEQLDEKCWDGYEKKGMKTMFGKRVPNCVKNEGEERNELDTPAVQAALARMAERHKGEKWSKEQLAALGKRIAARGQKPVKEGDIVKTPTGLIHRATDKYGAGEEPFNPHNPGKYAMDLTSVDKRLVKDLDASMGITYKNQGPKGVKVDEAVTKEDVISKLKAKLGDYLSDLSKEIKSDPDLVDKLAAKAPGDQMGPPVKTVTTDDGHEIQIHGNEDDGFRISIKNKPAATRFKNLDEAVMACEMYCSRRRKQTESADYVDEAGKDACYNKVKSRYKIWPSAYASGALVQCRKAGADNWGNKSKK